jgi:Na+/proline symporter
MYNPENNDRHGFFIAFGFYICWSLAIGFFAYFKSVGVINQDHYKDHFLGGKSIGAVALALTLFSTIFSGYTVVGVVAEAAGPLGFIATRWLSSAPVVGVSMLTMVPRYYQLSRSRDYNSPTDFVTDRFDCRPLSMLYSLIMSGQTVLYLVANLYTIKRLVPLLSSDQMDAHTTVWFIAAIMWVIEAIGGFNAIAKTDAIQSAVMIVSLIAIPCTATYYYNGASESVGLGCENLEVLNCTEPAYQKTVCGQHALQDRANFKNGCLLEASSNGFGGMLGPGGGLHTTGYKALYPATEWSMYFKPIHGAPFNNYGTDSSKYFSHTAAEMFGFNLLFFAFALNPHWIQRVIAGRSGASVKYAQIAINFAPFVATLPGIFLGIMVAANLVNVYPAGLEPYGIILSEFMEKGDFTEFLAVLGGVSVFAAIMSTVDSALHGVTNCLTSDFVDNGLFMIVPGLKKNPKIMLNISRFISFLFLVVAVCVALYDDEMNSNDPVARASIYGKLISWQNGLLWQLVPTTYLGMYMSDPKGLSHIVGLVVGFTVLVALTVYSEDQTYWGSYFSHASGTTLTVNATTGSYNFEESDMKTYYFNSGAALWAGFANLIVTWALNMCSSGAATPSFTFGLTKHNSDGSKGRLTGEKIAELMKDTTEPVKTPVGIMMIFLSMVLTTFSLPWWGDSYDDCDVMTLFAWSTGNKARVGSCTGPTLIHGLPQWVVVVIACFVMAIICNCVAFMVWKPDPKLSAPLGNSQDPSYKLVNDVNEVEDVTDTAVVKPKAVTQI